MTIYSRKYIIEASKGEPPRTMEGESNETVSCF
nr:MAG TPA: hypothetical protein [Caudoviricetes sp.]